MVLDENNNNLPEAVISVSGINHDVTSGRWLLPIGMRRKLPLPLLQRNQEAKLQASQTSRDILGAWGVGGRKGNRNGTVK